eukprot:jgi/Hompol1/5923/HPOL_002126-RA
MMRGGLARAARNSARTAAPLSTPSLVWFRSDLRLKDNPALFSACTTGGPVLALFVVSLGEWKNHNVGAVKIDFMLRNVRRLSAALQAINIPLIVRTAHKAKEVPAVVRQVVDATGARSVFWNVEYEVNESRRDAAIEADLAASGVTVHKSDSQLIVPPGVVQTNEQKVYTVYTPYKKKWIAKVNEQPELLKVLPTPSTVTAAVPEQALAYAKQH